MGTHPDPVVIRCPWQKGQEGEGPRTSDVFPQTDSPGEWWDTKETQGTSVLWLVSAPYKHLNHGKGRFSQTGEVRDLSSKDNMAFEFGYVIKGCWQVVISKWSLKAVKTAESQFLSCSQWISYRDSMHHHYDFSVNIKLFWNV